MGFRLGKHKNKLIALLLVLSIIVQQFVCPALIRATELDKGFYASYWDLFNSIASEMGYSMSEIKEDHNVSRPDVMDRANVSFLKFMDWLGQSPSINHSGGGHDIEDDSSGDHSGGGTSIREDTEVYLEEAKNLMQNATTKGIKMSQGLWDAFKQFFSDVENDKPITKSYDRSVDELNSLIKSITSVDMGLKSNDSAAQRFINSDHMCIAKVEWDGGYQYRVVIPQEGCSFTGWGYYDYGGYRYITHCFSYKHMYWGWLIYSDGKISCQNTNLYFNPDRENITPLVLDWSGNIGYISDVYSPYINYKSTGTAPAQVPDIIPWSTFPDHEVTDDDTKIYIPVESPDEETPTETPEDPTETPEQPTETPEDPTETPEDSDDGDDITNLVPIFPDIDIDPDIHLPDDWINPPDIDLDPDVDVDTPSPGGKIPHLQKLKEKFPFCIPFDLVLLFKMLNKKPKAPKWEFKHDFQIGDSKPYTWEVVVDMADYDKYVQIFREGFFLLFLVGLFFVTKKLISWQTG